MKLIRSLARCMAGAVAALVLTAGAVAQTRLTILDGTATLIRGADKSVAVVGMLLKDGDIIESADNALLVRLEFADKGMLDLGPSSRVWLHRASTAGAASSGINGYALAGWFKLAAAPGAGGDSALDSPWAAAHTRGSCVVELRNATALAFAEAGESHVVGKGPMRGTLTSLAQGQFLSLAEGSAAPPSAQPPAGWLAGVPRPFKDQLAPRRDRFEGKEVAAARGQPVTYADAEPWLKADAPVRNALMPRWKARARDPQFKAALIANMRHHPEWDRVLFPEKYRPQAARPTISAAQIAP
jgi:hypothetical protein